MQIFKSDIEIAFEIDKIVNNLLCIHPEARPFVCDGIPKTKSIFIAGYNPATSISKKWSDYWSCEKGYDLTKWTKDYERQRIELGKPKTSRTRLRINEIKKSKNGYFFETNIYSVPSKNVKSLSSKGDSLLREFIKTIRPYVLIVHGKEAERFIREMYPVVNNKIQEISCNVIFCTHLSRISNMELSKIKNKVQEFLNEA